MKAYQLKITIQNSEPSIWRRCIVPSGITFSQFSMILNEVMGWAGYHHFKFEFHDPGVELIEDAYDLPAHPEYQFLEAAVTDINGYISKSAVFTYLYDFGDCWEHEVIVEKVLNKYEKKYAEVLDYEQDCPMEDAGGIDQYQYHLEVMKDPEHPEYEDRRFWAENHTYYRRYDIGQVNESLAKNTVMYRSGEKRRQDELYEELLRERAEQAEADNKIGKKVAASGLRGSGNDLDEMRREIAAGLFGDRALRDVLECYTIPEIKDLAAQHGLRVPSAYRKKEIVDYVAEYILSISVMKRELAYLRDTEVREFEAAMNGTSSPGWEQDKNLDRLIDLGYVSDTSLGIYVVPTDVAAAYKSFADENFHEMRKEYSYFVDCLFTAGALYGVFTVSVLEQMYNQPAPGGTQHAHWSVAELLEELEELPVYYNDYTCCDGYIMTDDLLDEDAYKELIMIQGESSFYIPTREEISRFARDDFFSDEKYLTKLVDYIERTMGLDENEYQTVSMWIQRIIMNGGDQEIIFRFLQEEAGPMTPEIYNNIGWMLNDVWEHTRQIIIRGHTPHEINETVSDQEPGKIIDLEERRKNRRR